MPWPFAWRRLSCGTRGVSRHSSHSGSVRVWLGWSMTYIGPTPWLLFFFLLRGSGGTPYAPGGDFSSGRTLGVLASGVRNSWGWGVRGVDQHLASRRRRPVLWRWGTVLWDATGRHSYLRRDRHRLCVQAPLRGKRQSGLLRVRCLRTDIRFRSVTLQRRTYKGTCGLRVLAAILDLYAGKQWSDAGACRSSGASDPTVGTFDSEES